MGNHLDRRGPGDAGRRGGLGADPSSDPDAETDGDPPAVPLDPEDLPPRAFMTFSRQPHDLGLIQGPLVISGDSSGAGRSLKAAVLMVGETDVPLPGSSGVIDDSMSQDTLVMFDDTTQGNRTGTQPALGPTLVQLCLTSKSDLTL